MAADDKIMHELVVAEFKDSLRKKYGEYTLHYIDKNEKEHDLALISTLERVGLVDFKTCEELLKCEYYEITECDESCGNCFLAFKDDSNRGNFNDFNLGLYGAIYDVDKKKFITDFRYCHVYEKHEDRIKVANYNAGSKSVLYGFINSDGEEVVPCKYRSALDFRKGSAVVFNDWLRESGLIDKNGNELLPLQYSCYDFYIDKDLIVFGSHMPEGDTLYGVFNRKGENVIPCEYKKITYKHKSGYIQATKYNDEIEIFDKRGNKVSLVLKENEKLQQISQILQTAQTAEQKLDEIEKLIGTSTYKLEKVEELASKNPTAKQPKRKN